MLVHGREVAVLLHERVDLLLHQQDVVLGEGLHVPEGLLDVVVVVDGTLALGGALVTNAGTSLLLGGQAGVRGLELGPVEVALVGHVSEERLKGLLDLQLLEAGRVRPRSVLAMILVEGGEASGQLAGTRG